LVTFVCVSFGSSAVDLRFGFKSASKSLSEPFRKLGLAGVDFGTILFELFVELLAPFFDFVADLWPSSKSLSSSSVPFYNQREKKINSDLVYYLPFHTKKLGDQGCR
jgi:hypothetical protein